VLLLTEKVKAELPMPGLGIDGLDKLIVVPAGAPDAERLIDLWKPATIVVVIIILPFPICATLTEEVVVAIPKSGGPSAAPNSRAKIKKHMAERTSKMT